MKLFKKQRVVNKIKKKKLCFTPCVYKVYIMSSYIFNILSLYLKTKEKIVFEFVHQHAHTHTPHNIFSLCTSYIYIF